MQTKVEGNRPRLSESNRSIVRENYQLAMEYLEGLSINGLNDEMRLGWEQKDGPDAVVQFYIHFINRLPYLKDKKIKGLKLIYSDKYPLTYSNRCQILWELEIDEDKIKTCNVSKHGIWAY
ncbi:MAG: hypothetical protein IEMM0008_0702 [bacterium]|nr:MAG: hypothetical protein IEMM0008_0702 [bacterium]